MAHVEKMQRQTKGKDSLKSMFRIIILPCLCVNTGQRSRNTNIEKFSVFLFLFSPQGSILFLSLSLLILCHFHYFALFPFSNLRPSKTRKMSFRELAKFSFSSSSSSFLHKYILLLLFRFGRRQLRQSHHIGDWMDG